MRKFGRGQLRVTCGFTLLELLVVLGIIAILVLVAIPHFLNAEARARVSQAQINLRALVQANIEFKLDHGRFLSNPGHDDKNMPAASPNPSASGLFLDSARGDFVPLTSPIAYLSTIPADPFSHLVIHTSPDSVHWHYGTDPGADIAFVFESLGPDGIPNYPYASKPGLGDDSVDVPVRLPTTGRRDTLRTVGRGVWQLFFDNQVTTSTELRNHFTQGAAVPYSPPIDEAKYANPYSARHPRPYDPTNGARSPGDIAFLP